MRITFISACLDLSGGSRIIATHAKMLSDRGHQVTVVAPRLRPASLRKRLRSLWATGKWDPHYGNPSHYEGLGLDIRMVDHTPITDSDVPDADLIVATWWETAEWVNALSPQKGNKVYFVQGHEVFDFLPVERSSATYHMPFFKIVVSGWLNRIMQDTYGDHTAVLVPNSIDHTVFDAVPRDKQRVPTVGFMYAPGAVKGTEVALAAIRIMRSRLPELRVVSFGAHIPMGLADFESIEFRHMPSAQQLREAYSSCDVWLCTSRSEGFGLPAMEAMGCRTPVVSTRVGWPLDAIRDDVNGYLAEIDDVQAVADAAMKCLSLDTTAWRAMSDNAHQTSRSYSWDRSSALFEAALEAARQNHGLKAA